jgi:hypothetical protein
MSALIVMLTMSVVPAIAQSVDQRKSDAQKQVEALQAKLESAVERYNYACVKLENTRGQMAENKVKITQAEQQLAADRTRLNSRVRAMYVTRQVKMVDVVVSAKNIDEFLVGLDLAKKVSQRDAQMVRQVKDTKASLEQARSSLQQQKAEQEAATKEMSDSKAAVEGDLSGAKARGTGHLEDDQWHGEPLHPALPAPDASPGRAARRCRGCRLRPARQALCVGSRGPGLLRLLGPHHVLLQGRGRHIYQPQLVCAGWLRRFGGSRPASAGRHPRVPRVGPRRVVRRRRQLYTRAPDRGRREGLIAVGTHELLRCCQAMR